MARKQVSMFCSLGRHTECIERGEKNGIAPFLSSQDRTPCEDGCHKNLPIAIKRGEWELHTGKELGRCITNGHSFDTEAFATEMVLICGNCRTVVLNRDYRFLSATLGELVQGATDEKE